MKFKSDIEVQAGLKDSSGSNGTSGQVLSTTGSAVSWINQTTIANDVQNLVKAGVAINKGQAVYVTGADGTNIIVGLASNTSEATSSKTLGLLNATVAINGMADVVQIGRLAGLNTISATVGDPVWLGTNGNLIYGLANKPYAPAHLVFLGIVTRVNSNNGEIFVNVQNGFELNEIHDVDLKTNVPINGEVLGYDGTLWVNKTIAEWLGYTPANASGTTNYVSKFTGATTLGDSQIFDNGTFVGIGTNVPNATLQVGNGTGVKAIYVTGSGTNLGLGGLSVSFLGFATGTISTVNTSGAVPLGVGTRSTQPLILGTNNAERMRITDTGNVGIGTTSPDYPLEIENTNQTSIVYQRTGVSAKKWGFISDNGATYWSNITDNILPLTLQNNGNVGIGTTSPVYKLHVNDTSDAIVGHFSGGVSNYTLISFKSNEPNVYSTSLGSYNSGMLFRTGATDRMYITSGGNVGIGTTSPAVKFHSYGGALSVGDESSYSARFSNNSNKGVVIGYDSTNNKGHIGSINPAVAWTDLILNANGGNVGIGTTSPTAKLVINSGISNQNSYINGDKIGFSRTSDGAEVVYFKKDTSLGTEGTANINGYDGIQFRTQGAETVKAVITSTGNVGIGTTAPQAKLHINNGTDRNLWFRVNGSGTGTELLSINDAQSTRQSLAFSASSFYFDNGNVGIGTTSPSTKLDVNGSVTASQFNILNSNQTISIANTSDIQINASVASSNILFRVSGDERMRITASGNVGIGTTTPTGAKLDVNGSIRGFGAGNAGRITSTDTSGGGASITMNPQFSTGVPGIESIGAFPIAFQTNSSEKMRITSGGNVGIGATSPHASALLHLKSNSQGFLPPVMKTGERNSISSPAVGLMIFNKDDDAVQVYTVEGWRTLAWA